LLCMVDDTALSTGGLGSEGATTMIPRTRRAAVGVAAALLLTSLGLHLTVQAAAGSKGWIGSHGEVEAVLEAAPFGRFDDVPVGVTRPRHGFFAPGGLAAGATVKRLNPGRSRGFYESYKSEIAAYKLDRLLHLDMVPPTIERRVDGDLVSVQLWV